MVTTHDITPQLLRTDVLTGVGNLLGFFEWLREHRQSDPLAPFTLISLDIIRFELLNETYGRAAGDTALRWIALVLTEAAPSQRVYRMGDDEFVLVLHDGTPEGHDTIGKRIFERLKHEASLVNLAPPGARVAVIQYTGHEGLSPVDVLSVFYGAIFHLTTIPDTFFKVFGARTTAPERDLGGVINHLVAQTISLGEMLDESLHLAYTDAITGLPNMRKAYHTLERLVAHGESTTEPFVILLIDGDDLRHYNAISYLAGDDMIRRLGAALHAAMRGGDFLARWRVGDEFLVLLPTASLERAVSVGERLRHIVREASQAWRFPITISCGVAGYPTHGNTVNELVHHAERALDRAKAMGKNRVELPE